MVSRMNAALTAQVESIRQFQTRLKSQIGTIDERIRRVECALGAESAAQPQESGMPPGLKSAEPLHAAKLPPQPQPPPIPLRARLPLDDGEPVPQLEAYRPPAHAEPVDTRALEIRVGTYWFVRIGILLLLTGLVFLGNHVWRSWVSVIGPWEKLAAMTTCGLGMAAAGMLLHRGAQTRESLRNYSLVLLAGGLATLYYTAYGAHFVAALKVVSSPVTGGLLLLGMTALIIYVAEKWKSETVALLTVLLSFYTSAMNPIAEFSLLSNLILACGAVWFLTRHSRAALTYAGMAGSYIAFGFWRVLHGGALVWGTGLAAADFWPSRGFLLTYWLLFTAAFSIGGGRRLPAAQRATALTANNAAFFLYSAPALARLYPDSAWLLPLGMGLLLTGLAITSRRRKKEPLIESALLVQGGGLLVLALASQLSGISLPLCMALNAVVLLWLRGRDPVQAGVHLFLSCVCVAIALGCCVLLPHHGSGLWTTSAVLAAVTLMASMFRRQEQTPPGQMNSFSATLLGIVFLGAVGITWAQPWTSTVKTAVLMGLSGLTLIPWGRSRSVEHAALAHGFLFATCLPVLQYLLSGGNVPLFPARTDLVLSGLAFLAMALLWMKAWFGSTEKRTGEWVLTAVATFLLGVAMASGCEASDWAARGAVMAAVWLAGGLMLRSGALSVLSQVLLFTGLAACLQGATPALPGTAWVLLFVSAVMGIGAHQMRHRLPADWREPAAGLGAFWRVVTACLLAWLLFFAARAYVPVLLVLQILAWTAAGRRLHWPESSGVVACMAFLWLAISTVGALAAGNAGLLAVSSVMLIVGSSLLPRSTTDEAGDNVLVRKILTIAGILALLATVTGWTNRTFGHDALTAAWSALGCLGFAAGLILRERVLRLSALGILALALSRIFVVDVWQLSTTGRILSFLALGGVLLTIGYFYSRFADRLARWL